MNPIEKSLWLKDVFDGLSWGAQRDLERMGCLPPVGFLVGVDLPDAMMPLRFDTPEMKHECLRLLGDIAKTHGYDAAIVVSEAWMASHLIEEQDTDLPPPSEDPNKTEALIICMKHRDGSEQLRVVPFTRHADGKIDKFQDQKTFDGDKIHLGMMDVIFPQEHSTH